MTHPFFAAFPQHANVANRYFYAKDGSAHPTRAKADMIDAGGNIHSKEYAALPSRA